MIASARLSSNKTRGLAVENRTPNPMVHEALGRISRDIPAVARSLGMTDLEDLDALSGIIDNRLMPRLSPDLPLLAAVCGGGSSGKSSLFNTLVGRHVSPVGGRAGINRRVLLAARPAYFRKTDTLARLFEPFGCAPEPLRDAEDLTHPGCPLYVSLDGVAENLAVMDTPDFDTGAKGAYTNRQAAKQAFEAADIIVYVFTNSNYSNRDNTDFVARMLTGIGLRKCFLVYRVYPSFTRNEVVDHAMTVARNIYGDSPGPHVLGIYRADEDNAVASGERLLSLRPVSENGLPFADALNAIDVRRLRMELNASILDDALAIAADLVRRAKISRQALQLYVDALQAVQSRCTHEALAHFPLDQVMRRFSEIWMAGDPVHIRIMRKTGNVLEWPVRIIAGAVRQVRSGGAGDGKTRADQDYTARVKEDLIAAVNDLYRNVVGPEVSVTVPANDPAAVRMAEAVSRLSAPDALPGQKPPAAEQKAELQATRFVVPAHPVAHDPQASLKNRDWNAVIQSMADRKDVIVTLSESVEKELAVLADGFRRKMGLWDKVRQSFSAFLNVLPATAAVTYILHTGDPVGATGIKVKLTGLFGLKDLYALIAIPVTSGMKKADRSQIETLLGPIAQTWLQHKVVAVNAMFRQEITGSVLDTAEKVLDTSGPLIQTLAETVQLAVRESRREGPA